MQEHSTSALVIDIEHAGEADARVTLYTELFGKIVARARSLYKPMSKLAAHIQPLTLVRVRLVEKKGVQIVDALLEHRLISRQTPKAEALELLGVARLIGELTHIYQPDAQLWEVIRSGNLMSRALLRVLGFDPDHAQCQQCRGGHPQHFILRDSTYLCASCFTKSRSRASSAVEIPA
jgi:recombinational DNA repair protein (RecF pathway)